MLCLRTPRGPAMRSLHFELLEIEVKEIRLNNRPKQRHQMTRCSAIFTIHFSTILA